MYKAYTGIGSRQAPQDILTLMTCVAANLEYKGFTLRSGGADGCDTAVYNGVIRKAEIYLPWDGFNNLEKGGEQFFVPSEFENYDDTYDMMVELVPYHAKLSAGTQALHRRNIYQVLGKDLNTPSKFVLYWAEESKKGIVAGGTRIAVDLARSRDIPTFNLYKDVDYQRVTKLLEN